MYTLPKERIEIFAKPDQIKLAKEFAPLCYEKRKHIYKIRKQGDKEVIIQQIESSKIFEFAVYNYLKSTLQEWCDVKQPSTDLYDVPEFDADIELTLKETNENAKLNIKFQEEYSFNRYGLSWVFQRKDPIFTKKNGQFILLGACSQNKYYIISLGFVGQFKKYLGNMKKVELNYGKDAKYAIYYKPVKLFELTEEAFISKVLV